MDLNRLTQKSQQALSEHWLDGGGTGLDNLVLLCRSHHTAQHAGTSPWRITPPREPGAPPRFTRRDRDSARPPP